MNILIITTCFKPDSAIAAVRPYMLARHLSNMGERVTVLRSGAFEMLPFNEYDQDEEKFEVISALGENCDAEKFKRGEYVASKHLIKPKYSFLPLPVKVSLRLLRDIIRMISGKKIPKCLENMTEVLKFQKKIIDDISDRHYDVVFATFGAIENIPAGIYAAEVFDAKLIIDYRDSAIRHDEWMDLLWNSYARNLNKTVVKKADCITAVSNAITEEMKSYGSKADVVTIYNGFDDTADLPEADITKDVLSICYTGRLYRDRLPALFILAECIADMIDNGIINRKNIKFKYAGSDSAEFLNVLNKAKIADLFQDSGYLSRLETLKLQISSDVFLVLSWNNRNSQGILTGKFYEGIQAGKPIIACVSGKTPNSELMQLQKKYNYGFCFEEACKKEYIKELKFYIEKIYKEKLENGILSYQPSDELYQEFSYTCISDKVHNIMRKLAASNGADGKDKNN